MEIKPLGNDVYRGVPSETVPSLGEILSCLQEMNKNWNRRVKTMTGKLPECRACNLEIFNMAMFIRVLIFSGWIPV
jgi:hypothetical protein